MKAKNQYRQGDVFLKPSGIPSQARPGKTDGRRIVLAYGEVTGHAHAIADIGSVALRETKDGRRFLDVKETTPLTHEEHGAIHIDRGSYEIIIQREYTPEEIRNVAD